MPNTIAVIGRPKNIMNNTISVILSTDIGCFGSGLEAERFRLRRLSVFGRFRYFSRQLLMGLICSSVLRVFIGRYGVVFSFERALFLYVEVI